MMTDEELIDSLDSNILYLQDFIDSMERAIEYIQEGEYKSALENLPYELQYHVGTEVMAEWEDALEERIQSNEA